MRKLLNVLTVSLALFAAGGCGWLDVTPENVIAQDDLFSTGYGFRNALNGVYLKMGENSLYGRNLSWGFLSAAAQEYVTDASQQGMNTLQEFKDAAGFHYNSSTPESVVQEIWDNQYSAIANINNILASLDDCPASKFAFGDDEKALIRGEALALRAYLHFDLLRLFAPAPAASPTGTWIPYRTEFEAAAGTPLSVSSFIEKTIADIAAALPLLKNFDLSVHPQAMYSSMMSSATPHWCARYRFESRSYIDNMGQFFWYRGWRMNYMASLALMARVCFYAGKAYYPNAKTAAKELYNDFATSRQWLGFTPAENITAQSANRFAKLSDDVIFAAYHKDLAAEYESTLWSSGNNIRMPLRGIQELYASDNTGIYSDYRLNYTISQSNASNRTYYSRKYLVSSDQVVESVENPMVPLIRFSEVCHILAEIAASENDLRAGINYLETVRRARGAERSLSLTVGDAASLMEEITLDARKEYICEGNMFYFYKRRALVDVLPLESAVLPIPKSENPL